MSEHRRGGVAVCVGVLMAVMLAPGTGTAAELKAATVAAFDRYVTAAERRMDEDLRGSRFLWIDGLDASRQAAIEDRLRRGELVTEKVDIQIQGKPVDVPDGIIHHWVGIVFVPGATADTVVRLLQDYDRHSEIFAPNVVRSRTLAHEGDRFRLFLRFHMKKVLSVTLNTESVAEFVRLDDTRTYSKIRSTRVAEVAEAGTPAEHEKPVGHDTGFMWRLNTYWRVLQRDGGTFVQCESITLSRDIPFGLGWIIRPFITEVPKESLTFTLQKLLFATRKSLPGR